MYRVLFKSITVRCHVYASWAACIYFIFYKFILNLYIHICTNTTDDVYSTIDLIDLKKNFKWP